MNSSQFTRSQHFSLLTVFLLLLILQHVCFGYGNLQFKDDHGNTVNSLWDQRSYDTNSFPEGIPWLLNNWDPCSVIDVNLSEFQAIVNDAFETWEAVPEANICFVYGGLTDNNSVGNGQGLPPNPALDGDNVIVFDELDSDVLAQTFIFTLSDEFTFDGNDADPNNDPNFSGTDPNPDIPEGTYPAGTILDADIMLNKNSDDWSLTGEYDKDDLQAVLVHEIGHFIGLCHSCIGNPFPSMMYPFAEANPGGLSRRNLSEDDKAGVSFYYPSSLYPSTYGSISGHIQRKDNGVPVPSAHVYAKLVGEPNHIVAVYSDEFGNYQINGLINGSYIVGVEPLPKLSKHYTIGDRINDIVESTHDVDFLPQIYDSNYCEISATLIETSAGTDYSNLDFEVLDGDIADAFEDDDNIIQVRTISDEGKQEIHNIYPENDVDNFQFSGTVGKEYLIRTTNHGEYASTYVTVTNSGGKIVAAQKEDSYDSWICFLPDQNDIYKISVKHWTRRYVLSDKNGQGTQYFISVLEQNRTIYYVDCMDGSDLTGIGTIENPWASISHAIESVTATKNDPQNIFVAEGSYFENVTLRRYMSIYGGFNPTTWTRDTHSNETTIDASGAGNVVQTADYSRIDGFIIRDGERGVFCNGSAAIIANCFIRDNDNTAEGFGVGMLCKNPNMSPSIIINNRIGYNLGHRSEGADIRGYGCGIYIHNTCPLISGNQIFKNQSAYTSFTNSIFGGGGIQVTHSLQEVSCEISNNIIAYNTAKHGAGIYCYDAYHDRIIGNIIIGNTGEVGGGIGTLDTYSRPHIEGNIIISNSATYGGGLNCRETSNESPVIAGNMIVGNVASELGGGARFWWQRIIAYNNCWIGNSASQGGGIYWGDKTNEGKFLNNAICYNKNDGITVEKAALGWNPLSALFEFRNNIVAYNMGTGLNELEDDCDGDIYNNNFFANELGDYYDHDTDTTFSTATGINQLVQNGPYADANNNVDWNPGFRLAPGGTAGIIAYDPNTFQSVLTDSEASFEPNELSGLTINPDTNQPLHFYIISNTGTTITTWGDMNSVASLPCTYQVFDYHLAKDSRNIEAGMDVSEYIETDIDGDQRPLYDSFDIGADEVFPIAGDFEPDEDVDWTDVDTLTDYWLDSCNEPEWCEDCDIDQSSSVDFIDFAKLALNWLAGVE